MPTRRRYGPTRTSVRQRYPHPALRKAVMAKLWIPEGMPIDHLVPTDRGTLGFLPHSYPPPSWDDQHERAEGFIPARIPCMATALLYPTVTDTMGWTVDA